MEFWGVEVKAGKPLKVQPDEFYFIHLSQASLGESKSSETVPIFVKVGDQKLVLGTLSHEHSPQISFDLVFEKEFELSHNWKSGSVYFLGYKTPFPDEGDEELFGGSEDSESEDEELPMALADNGKVENAKAPKAIPAKAEASVKPKGKVVEPSKEAKSEGDDDDDESDEDEESDTDSEDVDEMSEDEDDDSDDSDEETPKKVDVSKKRANESATKTPVPAKKAKIATQKTDGKKCGHTATPHPAKQANNNTQSPKSGCQFACSSCSKKFTSEVGLQSHTKAKHSGK